MIYLCSGRIFGSKSMCWFIDYNTSRVGNIMRIEEVGIKGYGL